MKILITGPLGQDGTILTELLQNKHELFGVCRITTPTEMIESHKKKFNIDLFNSELSDSDNVNNIITKIKPDVIINFAGETDVINPWDNPLSNFEQNFKIPTNLLNSISKINRDIFFFQSSSSLMYGRSKQKLINEESSTSPMYPYGVSKLSAHNLLKEYRNNFDIKCCSGIFFNHESTYRNKRFVTKKLSTQVSKILNGSKEKIKLFDLNYYRDISHAEDFMSGVQLIIENYINNDFIFSSGEETNYLELSKRFFQLYNLDFYGYIDYTESNNNLNYYNIIGDNSRLKSIGWEPKYDNDKLIIDMINKELNK